MKRNLRKRVIDKPVGMTLVGLTGGIASGKTEAAKIMQENDISVISMDELAKSLYVKDTPVYKRLLDTFGEGMLDDDAGVDHAKLAALVFNNPDRLQELNRIVHPVVFMAAQQIIQGLFEQGIRLVVIESAILFESGLANDMDFTVEVVADLEARIERAVRTRGMSRADALARINAQSVFQEGRADYLLSNKGSLQELRIETLGLVRFLKHRYIEVNKDG